MDLICIGKFIGDLRKEKGLTQEALGEKLGVSNKTVSRWETGTYMPPADILLSMSELFEVSINEILSGKRLSEKEYVKAAEENLIEGLKDNVFSRKEKEEYFKKKWLQDNAFLLILIGMVILGIYFYGFWKRKVLLGYISVLLFIFAHGWRNNTQMSYVEKKIYDEE